MKNISSVCTEGRKGEKKMFSHSAGSVWAYSCSWQCYGNHCPHIFGFIHPFLTLKGNTHWHRMNRVKTPASLALHVSSHRGGVLTHQHILPTYFPALAPKKAAIISHLLPGFGTSQLLYFDYFVCLYDLFSAASGCSWCIVCCTDSNGYLPPQNEETFTARPPACLSPLLTALIYWLGLPSCVWLNNIIRIP